LVVGLPTFQLSADFSFLGSVKTRLIIKALWSSFRLTFRLEYEYDEVRLPPLGYKFESLGAHDPSDRFGGWFGRSRAV